MFTFRIYCFQNIVEVVIQLNSGGLGPSTDQYFCVVFLGKTLNTLHHRHCHHHHHHHYSTLKYKWVPVYCWAKLRTKCSGVAMSPGWGGGGFYPA